MFRSLFLSDLHLGFKGCQTDRLSDFLHCVQAENIFLLGDIIDLEAMRLRFRWSQMCTDILKLLLKTAQNGTQITYVPGNHDNGLRAFLQVVHFLGQIQISPHMVHTLADGREMLLMHGDEFENRACESTWTKSIGSRAYNVLLLLNQLSNSLRGRMNLPYWSLSNYLRSKSKLALSHIDKFETAGAGLAGDRNLDGIICGHIHTPKMRHIDGVLYGNCGDWIESCTALAETHQGNLVLLDWKSGTMSPEYSMPNLTVASQYALSEA